MNLAGLFGLAIWWSLFFIVTMGNAWSEPNESQAIAINNPETQKQITRLEAQITAIQQDYKAQIQRLQNTIETLMVEIHKQNASQQTVRDKPPSTPSPVLPTQQEIGEELIFGEDEPLALASVSNNIKPQRSTPLSAKGFAFSGRSPLDVTTQPFSTSGANLGQMFNPDVMVTGDFVSHYTNRNSVADRGRVSVRESEFGFSAAVDPYAKAAFIFSKPDGENLDLEEGYLTLLSLPYGLQAKVGQMRSPFGKLNVIHGHDLPQTDRPDVYVNFFGDEGLVESGVSLSKILPTSWFSSLDVQVANGDNSTFFGHGRLDKPLIVGRWKNFFDLPNNQSLEIGLSGATAPNIQSPGSQFARVGGMDLTYRWLPPSQLHALIWQTELLAGERKNPTLGNPWLFGGYSFLEYKLSNRWHAGVRIDYTQYPTIANAQTIALAPYVDFWESEFGRWRAEFKHTFGDSQVRSSDQAWLQYTVILGLHPPHTF